jgi:hypothetical protein
MGTCLFRGRYLVNGVNATVYYNAYTSSLNNFLHFSYAISVDTKHRLQMYLLHGEELCLRSYRMIS